MFKLSTRYLSRSFPKLPQYIKIVSIHRVCKTKKNTVLSEIATTSQFKMLNHNSNATNQLESQSGLKAKFERFGGGGAKSRRFGGRLLSSAKCSRFFPCVVDRVLSSFVL